MPVRTRPQCMRVSGKGMDYLRCMLRDSMRPNRASSLAFWLLAAFLTILWVAGGASRSDVFGQVVVRFSGWLLILGAVMVLPRLPLRLIGWPALILGGSVVLVAVQLLPLPSSMWTQLPGRSLFSGHRKRFDCPAVAPALNFSQRHTECLGLPGGACFNSSVRSPP